MIWVKAGVSFCLLLLLAWQLDLREIGANLKHAEAGWLLPALALLVTGQALSAVRWYLLARGLGLDVRLGRKLQLYFLGMFMSLFLPSIIGGDVVRGYLLAKGREGTVWKAAASVLLERLNGVVAIMVLVGVSLPWLDIPRVWMWLWLSGCLGLFLLQWMLPRFWPFVRRVSMPAKFSGWKQLPLEQRTFCRSWWMGLALSLLFQLMVVQAHVFLGMAVGLELGWAAYAVMVCLVALAAALPISFNGFGIREAGYLGFATYFGGAPDAAASMAVLWVVVLLLAALPGGAVLWKMGGSRAMK